MGPAEAARPGIASRLLYRLGAAGAARPRAAVVAAALAATIVAMYPIVFFGRSLATPNNGPAPLLFYEPPFTPGSDDRRIEPALNSDSGSMLFAMLPYSIVQREALAQGEWPLWNRYNSAGRPLWGQGQTFLLDPLHWPTIVLPDVALGWDVKFVLHRLVFAIGVGLCALSITGSWPAAATVAFMAPFSRQYLFRLNHPAQFALTYAPFVLHAWFAVFAAVDRRRLTRAAAYLAAATALLLVASPPKEAVVMLAAMHGTGALTCLLKPAGWRPLAAQMLAAGAGVLAAALLTAPHWLVFLDTLERSATLYDQPSVSFASWIAPIGFFLSPLSAGVLVAGVHALGLAAASATLTSGRRLWSDPRAVAVATGTILVVAMAYGLIPASVIVRLPLVGNIGQIDHTLTAAAVVLFLVAGAPGVAQILHGAALAPALVMATSCAGMFLLLALNIHRTSIGLGDFEVRRVSAIAVIGLLWIWLTARAARRWPDPAAAALSLLAALAIVLPNGLHLETGLKEVDTRLTQPRLRPDYRATSGAVDAIHRDQTEPFRTAGLDGILAPGSQALYHLEGLNGPDALWLASFEEVLNAGGVQRVGWESLVSMPYLQTAAPVLDLVGIRYLLALEHRVPPQADVLRNDGRDRARALRRDTAWPRAFFVDRVGSYRTMAEFIEQVRAARGPFAAVLQADRDSLGVKAPSAEAAEVIRATDYHLTANRTEFRVRTSGPGLAVLMEAWMPEELVATRNGEAAAVVRVNHAFRGVAIPAAGDWTIAVTYRPARLGIALIGTATGIVMVAALLLPGFKRGNLL